MAVRRLAEEQPASFEFSAENRAWVDAKIKEYPEGRQASAIIPILWKAQEQHNGWLPEPAIRLAADMLDMPYIRALEVATFYTMFQLNPVGTVAHIGVCGTTPCMLRGAEELVSVCKKRIASKAFALSDDGRFSWEEVECAGACVNAPMVQIGSDTFEDLTVESFEKLLDDLAAGNAVAPGPQSGRKGSEPLPGATSLLNGVSKNGAAVEATEAAPEPSAPVEEAPAAAEASAAPEPAAPDDSVARADAAGTRPQAAPDDTARESLQQLSGIGPVIESKLYELGVVTIAQIASWDEATKAWVNEYLAFKGRIDREKWIEQAQALISEKSE